MSDDTLAKVIPMRVAHEKWRIEVGQQLPCFVDADGQICDLKKCDQCGGTGTRPYTVTFPCSDCNDDDGTPPGYVAIPREGERPSDSAGERCRGKPSGPG